MSYRLEFAPAAARQFRDLPKTVQERLKPRIDALAEEPRGSGREKIQGMDDVYRIRVGRYRIVYQIQDDRLIVAVLRLGDRRDVYRNL